MVGPLAGGGLTIAAGDFNSPADGSSTATYRLLREAGMSDSWTAAGQGAGFTCCQAELLDNPTSTLDERVDLILTRGDAKTKEVELVGNQASDRIAGLWPSDHGGLVATIRLRDKH